MLNLGAYEILYTQGQRPLLGNPFISLNTADFNEPTLRELVAFEFFCREEIWTRHSVSGLLSPRFTKKTGIETCDVKQFINNNPEREIYLFHPYPRELRIQRHFMELAELEHPGISNALSRVWTKILDKELPRIYLPSQSNLCCHCNFILAKSAFWEKYSGFVISFMELLRRGDGTFLLQPTPYTLTKTGDKKLPIAVFVFERALSHFIYEEFDASTVLNYTYTKPGYYPPELFTGEDEYVNNLIGKYHSADNSKKSLPESQASRATLEYYSYRKIRRKG